MKLFEEIDEVKKDLPNIDHITKKNSIYKLFIIVISIVGCLLGIFLGKHFATCEKSIYENICLSYHFNFLVMLVTWFIIVLLEVFFISISKIVSLLQEINEKVDKFIQ